MIRYNLWVLVISTFFAVSAMAENQNNLNKTLEKSIVPANLISGIDPESGLKIAAGWDIVKTNCTVCHSAKIIVLQQGSRDTWLEMIRWMQKTQGLWEFDPQTEKTILDYLANNYPPVKVGRRANLPASALPPNPWQKCCPSKYRKPKVIVLKKR
jgi:cytochrome c5